MNWLDLFIILFLLASLVRGVEVGFVRQFFSTTGFLGGLFLGAWLQGKLIDSVQTPASKALLVLLVTLGCALLLMTVGEYIGLRLKFKLRETKLFDKLDRIFGSAVAGATILVAIWFGAAIFRNVPSDGWQRQISGSRIIAVLNDTLPSAPGVISKLGHLIDPNGFPQVFTGLEPKLETDAPLPELGSLQPVVEAAKASIVKIQGEGCGGVVEGSGLVAAEGLVITNAHVVAGVEKPLIVDAKGEHRARVISFDPRLDVAILRTSNLAGEALPLDSTPADDNEPGVVLGYPGGGGFTVSPAVVLDAFTARGRDIYNQEVTERSIYSLKADVRQGNSGGPLLDAQGAVIGVIFAESTGYDDVGYALTMQPVIQVLAQAKSRTAAVGTGSCT